MTKNTKLSKSDVEKMITLFKSYDARISYIVKYIVNIFKFKTSYYWELLDGDLNLNIKKLSSKNKFIEISSNIYDAYIFEKNVKPSNQTLINLSEKIPKNWLFEDFEHDLIIGRRKYQSYCNQIEQAKKDEESRKLNKILQQKEKSIINIKTKLTDAEWGKLKEFFKG